ncbi:MAG: hypothetical protein V4557_02035 [Bacteroidota bacterium]
MKKLLLTTAVVMGALLFNNETKAQVRIGVNVNIGTRPSWGLPGNYAGDYYYMPEIDTYYDIRHRQFIYLQGRNWVFANELPYMYRGYDLNRGYKVMINEPRPYLRGDVYRSKYGKYYDDYHRRNQSVWGRNDNDRNNNGRDDRFEKGRDNDRNDHDRGRGNDRDDRGRNSRGRG